jgi:hypothetical protein
MPRPTAAILVGAGSLIVWLLLDVRGFRPVLARGWHDQRFIRGILGSFERCQACLDGQLTSHHLAGHHKILCLQSTCTLSATVAGLGFGLFPVSPGRSLSGLVVVRRSGRTTLDLLGGPLLKKSFEGYDQLL